MASTHTGERDGRPLLGPTYPLSLYTYNDEKEVAGLAWLNSQVGTEEFEQWAKAIEAEIAFVREINRG